ncbi:mannose-6-phosphate isomerase-like [Dendronephthya gigantea]|uniref:mannose-6-phosphate isomerase-like n=1 Tax=Dendronephthya gigantea TaxID=151771 RepID=UPI00106C1515|nr:mannose-6-phosphate isomerase-like [Dendronephthya gigantea]
METVKAVALRCCVQTYAWGRRGSLSTVARLAQNNTEFQLDEETPYAEYWMGTHKKGPSVISNGNNEVQITLEAWIRDQPACALGEEVLKNFGGSLPFLFKVLSVNKGLSIQAHPTKELAAQLHREKPENYPDDNHKPEMAIALTDFEGLCGFRPYDEVAKYLDTMPELRTVVGIEESSLFVEACKGNKDEQVRESRFKKCFRSLMTRDTNVVKESLSALVNRMSKLNDSSYADLKELLLRLNSQFPGDVGCFCIFFMNHIILKPGQAMFLAPNLPHAYLDGDCIECMACSDNTIRAGLTPKFRDVETLCDMLDYTAGSREDNMFKCERDPTCLFSEIYDPPVPDFAVRKILVPCEKISYTLKALNGPSIIIIIEGKGHFESSDSNKQIVISPGTTVFCSARHVLNIEKDNTELLMFQAYCELSSV